MARLPQHLSKAPVGRERLSREALGEYQRERILVGATAVFAKRGYQASTIDNIVAAADIGVGSFYLQFESKEECLLAAYARIVSRARGQVAAAVPAGAPWPRQALAVIGELLSLIAAEPLSARVALIEIQTGGAAALERYAATLDLAIAALGEGRAVLSASPEPPATLEEATASGVAWLLARRLVVGELGDPEELFDELGELVLEPYLGPAKARREIAAHRRALAKA